mmetsp:Transcript_14320/g.29448  ORF Transcript_14320/g.29448 Transcript_14320/m.29448 type:complete len:1400 (-) Transcript_14320:60-4259(-)|eukprot:CAMPEP_0118658310 /NCGR_PEP_ID=MMETSP0785-20121206/14500_1 /TAXON_ID=91992 /ORGANISM="Bolidomonas pacifica, Strain CCMP 1866" /LENGTH=1399 /DNA_ID=CAMNT_0006551319 /DNA_START=358 /DNA_END=4557 /DNA_ORIENTATION=+
MPAISQVKPMVQGGSSRKSSLSAPRKASITGFFSSSKVNTTQSLDPDKFSSLMSYHAVDFEESVECFQEHSNKLKTLLECEACNLYLVNEKEHQLYTIMKGKDGKPTKVFKPMDRGLGSQVVDQVDGLIVDNVQLSPRWDSTIDELAMFTTSSYLAWPLRSPSGECIGSIEARNKIDKSAFSTSDTQVAQIFAQQLSSAIVRSKQNALLADRDDAFRKAYEKNFDASEAIVLKDREREARLSGDASLNFAASELGVETMSISDIQRWDYDVFTKSMEELEMLFIDIFEDRGLFGRFSIDIKTFMAFTKNIVMGYNATPYHNHFHAFDVMHVAYLFISTCNADGFLEDFNVLSLLVGAIAHDVGHDGYNNAFHATTMSELAITYNSISILENYSAAFLFRTTKVSGCDIFERMDNTELKKLRGRLIEMILDTDAKNHFILMTRFKHGMEMKQLSRGLLSSMILHISDVSNPTRPNSVSRKWSFAVQEEFFRQGDEEKRLGLAVSPFMDREYENLPRMQGAFIDAIVSPVFHLCAEFLPLIEKNCIKNMQVNRAFWNKLQNKQILTTADVKKDIERGEAEAGQGTDNGEEVEQVGESLSSKNFRAPEGEQSAIPGIPQNAPKEVSDKQRKMSLIALKDSQTENFSMQVAMMAEEDEAHQPISNFFSFSKRDHDAFKKKCCQWLDGNWVQLIMLFCTAYALIADDLSLWIGDKENDGALSIITFVVLILFTLELLLSMYCVPEYMYFFFWLDLIAALSLIPEIGFLVGEDDFSSSGANKLEEHGTLTRAGRAAKAGARAGRVARVLRLIRLVRIIKLFKWMTGYFKRKAQEIMDHSEDADEAEEVDMKMSNVGRKMTESITKKVILAVIFMLLMFSLFEDLPTPDARVWQLDDITKLRNETIREEFKNNYISRYISGDSDNPTTLFKLVGIGDMYEKEGHMAGLRSIEIEQIWAPSNNSVYALFDISKESQNTAMHSFIMTLVVTALLASLSMLFSRDAYTIMIKPIEKMKHTVQKLSENPFLHLEKLKKEDGKDIKDENETDMLEAAITKMARLLQIGFGSAGAEIIANNLSDGGELNPMVPGSKIEAIFGFCDIREFTFATEGLQQDVMLFVNKIAEITHKHVVESGGAPNKNIGDAFLLVWKLKAGGGELQKSLFDNALLSFMKIIDEIKKMGNLAAFMEGAPENASWRSSLQDFKVHMGFGLHMGWAIEGSIGSKVKVDASYLSPHVNLASRLEAATKQFKVPLLMSEDFVKGLTGSAQNNCRRVDSVTFKGSNEPMKIFHFDSEAFEEFAKGGQSDDVKALLAECKWDKAQAKAKGIDLAEVDNLFGSKKGVLVKQIYDRAFESYVDGDWGKAKIILVLWLERFPQDKVAAVLLERLKEAGFQAPPGWPGYHALTEK